MAAVNLVNNSVAPVQQGPSAPRRMATGNFGNFTPLPAASPDRVSPYRRNPESRRTEQ